MHLSAAKNTSFSRSLLAGIVCGILAGILNVAYTVVYRKATDFTAYKVVEPLLIFIAFSSSIRDRRLHFLLRWLKILEKAGYILLSYPW